MESLNWAPLPLLDLSFHLIVEERRYSEQRDSKQLQAVIRSLPRHVKASSQRVSRCSRSSEQYSKQLRGSEQFSLEVVSPERPRGK